jgi:AraC-like DNA-binding protein
LAYILIAGRKVLALSDVPWVHALRICATNADLDAVVSARLWFDLRGSSLPLVRADSCRNKQMSYDHAFLFKQILLQMTAEPCISVRRMSRELRVSCRTIQEVIRDGAMKSYTALRREILIAKTVQIFAREPGSAIKQVSFAIGFASPRSFARAIRKACGVPPEVLRARVLAEPLPANGTQSCSK